MPTETRPTIHKKVQTVPVSRPDDGILQHLNRWRILSASQLALLTCDNALDSDGIHPKPWTVKYLQRRLKRLTDEDYTEASQTPNPSRFGSTPLVYSLGAEGFAYLRARG